MRTRRGLLLTLGGLVLLALVACGKYGPPRRIEPARVEAVRSEPARSEGTASPAAAPISDEARETDPARETRETRP